MATSFTPALPYLTGWNIPSAIGSTLLSASNAVQNALDNALIYAAARFNVDDALTADFARFQETVRARATETLQKENARHRHSTMPGGEPGRRGN